MAREHWTQVTIPKEFRDLIEKVVRDYRFGYRNAPEFARDAFRRLLIELDAFPRMPRTEVEKDDDADTIIGKE